MTKNKKENGVRRKEEVFDSGLKIAKSLTVLVPYKLFCICNTIQSQVPGKEFSILCLGKHEGEHFKLTGAYVIPPQEVTGTTVDYKDHMDDILRAQGWNVVIHSHPFQSKNFSGSDDETINSNFDCSILYSLATFPTSVVNIKTASGTILQINCEVEIEEPISDAPVDTSMITVKEYGGVCGWSRDPDEAYTGEVPIRRMEEWKDCRVVGRKIEKTMCGLDDIEICQTCYNAYCPGNMREPGRYPLE